MKQISVIKLTFWDGTQYAARTDRPDGYSLIDKIKVEKQIAYREAVLKNEIDIRRIFVHEQHTTMDEEEYLKMNKS